MELRPGDSLLDKIATGIDRSDYLLVLVTQNSNQSKWVNEEVDIARTKEINEGGPKVIPIVVSGSEVPAKLASKLYITIDEVGRGIEELIPAIFRDSYILDISLRPHTLTPDVQSLSEEFYDFVRTDYSSLIVRIHNCSFTKMVLDVTRQTLLEPDLPAPVAEQIRRASALFHIEIPMYWSNLAQLLTDSLNTLFVDQGKSLDTIRVALRCAENALTYAQMSMVSHLAAAVFAVKARKYGHNGLAAYIDRFEGSDLLDDESIFRDICSVSSHYQMHLCDLVGDSNRQVINQKLLIPVGNTTDTHIIQMTCEPDAIIDSYSWYIWCLPQLIRRALHWTSFREGKPMHELGYKIGLRMSDYSKLGLS